MSETEVRLDGACAREMVAAARVEAGATAPLAIGVVDANGHPLAFVRMDDAMLAASHSVPARTALLLDDVTTPFVRRAERDPVVALSLCRAAGLVVSAGAIPLRDDGRVVGAIGASGGRAAEDARASESGAEVWRRRKGSC